MISVEILTCVAAEAWPGAKLILQLKLLLSNKAFAAGEKSGVPVTAGCGRAGWARGAASAQGAQPTAGAGPPVPDPHLNGGGRGAPHVQQVKTTLQSHVETQTTAQTLLFAYCKTQQNSKKYQPRGAALGFEQTLFPRVVL